MLLSIAIITCGHYNLFCLTMYQKRVNYGENWYMLGRGDEGFLVIHQWFALGFADYPIFHSLSVHSLIYEN